MAKQVLTIFLLLLSIQITTAAALAATPVEAPAKPEPPVKTLPAKSPANDIPAAAESPSDVPLVQAPPHRARAAPTNVSKVLEKAGSYSVFIRLLKSTSASIQIENQLNSSNSLTIFAPTNGAFSALKPGTLNALSAEQKVQLVQFHVLPAYVSFQNFQTLSNPVRTQASSSVDYPMNVTVEGTWVNISTGMVNASIAGTVYDDGQLAVYRLDKVLLPLGVFAPKPKQISPAPAPPMKPAKGGVNGSASGSASSSLESESPVSSENDGGHHVSGVQGKYAAVDLVGVFAFVVVSVLGQYY